jgi:type IX secretion system PorP/SprF family membrane protein
MNGVQFLDASIGIYSAFRENTFGGLTLNNLVRSRLDGIVSSKDNESFLSYYIFYLGHRIPVDDLKFNVEPSIMIRQIKDAPFQVDINFKAGFLDDQLLAGISYRSLGVLGVMLGASVTSFNLYYTYDVSFQRFQQYNSGAHEVTVALDFKGKTQRSRSY